MIYNSFFGLREEPFGVTPDPRFLFASKKHEEAIAIVNYGISARKGFIMLSGEVGSGKTTVIRHIFDSLGPETRTAMVMNPRMDSLELLKFINQDFGLSPRRNATHKVLMDDLNEFLIGCHKAGGAVVLAIDEAQEMSPECLEFVRLISNLETDTRKLIQIILIGQPELRDLVGSTRLRQLDQRIAVRYHLEPLDLEETRRYIRYRLEVAGSRTVFFPEKGIKAIHRFSGGIPRLINLCCDRVLLASYASEEFRIRPGRVKEAIEELKKEEVLFFHDEAGREGSRKLELALAAITLAVFLGLFIHGITGQREVTGYGIETQSLPGEKMAFTVSADENSFRLEIPPALFVKDGIYMATAPELCEKASLLNLLGILGEKEIDENSLDSYLGSGEYSVYVFHDMDVIPEFNMPVALKLDSEGSERHVTLKSVVGDYALVFDPLEGKLIVPFEELKESAVEGKLLYKKGLQKPSEDGEATEDSVPEPSGVPGSPTLSP